MRQHQFETGDHVMIYMPSAVTRKAWKLARPYHGPYRVVSVTPTNVEARIVNDPDAETIFVAVNRVRHCYPKQTNTLWKGSEDRNQEQFLSRQQAKQPSLNRNHILLTQEAQ